MRELAALGSAHEAKAKQSRAQQGKAHRLRHGSEGVTGPPPPPIVWSMKLIEAVEPANAVTETSFIRYSEVRPGLNVSVDCNGLGVWTWSRTQERATGRL